MCSSTLGAFGGFLCQSFREHDFQLGRRNCQRFLREHFALPEGNSLFDGWRNNRAMLAQFACATPDLVAQQRSIPIIPLVGGAALEVPDPQWPTPHDFDGVRDEIYKLLGKRLEAIYDRLLTDQNWFAKRYLDLGWLFVKPMLLKQVKATIEDKLKERGLYWAPTPQGRRRAVHEADGSAA